jgi:hypothetical protein
MSAVFPSSRRILSFILLLGLVGGATAQTFNVLQFRPWAGYAIPNGLWLTGDFNADGKQDIVHAVAGSSYVHVWTSNGSGGFSVGTFSPWPGYAIPNGVWRTGDFNGDGRTDILHAVANTDYVHVWTSKGDGTFTVSTFSPWRGYAIPNGLWLTGDFNRDGRTDIFHAVANSDYAHVWTSNGNGTFTLSTFRPWSGYAIPNGEWLTGDFNGDGRTDVFHAVANSDYAHIWTSNGAGGFTVGTFRPWAGYAIPNGVWMAADFNGDGRTDVFHAVASGDYAHIWTSSGGAGSFTVGTFRPWAGYAIPNGLWMTGDFDGDGRADVLHAVANSSYVHTWRSTGVAQFSVGTFSPWAGYAIPNGLWLPADITGDGKTDIVHAVQNTDYVHPWISNMITSNPNATQVAVTGIEVTQAIQDMPHSVALVAGRRTLARVYLDTNSAAPLTVTGTLLVRNATSGATTTVNSTGNAVVNPAQNGQLRPKRENFTASLNFNVPAGFTVLGAHQFSLSSVTNVTGAAVACTNCGVATRAVSYINSSALRVRILGLQYTTGTPPATATQAPSAADFTLLRSWLLRAYPTDQLIASQATIASTNAWPFTCGNANAQLATVRANDIAGGTDARTHYYGLVSNGGGYMRGCSSGVPAAADPTTVASGPTGNPAGPGSVPVNAAGDNDASYGDWYGGHELGHTFGRPHPGFCNGNSADDPGFPYPNGQISTNDGAFTGLDVGDAGNAIATTVLPGASRFDIMTYCNQPQWPSARNYQAIRGRLNVEDAAFPSSPGPGSAGAGAAAARARATSASRCPCDIAGAPSLKGEPAVVVGSRVPAGIAVSREGALEIPKPASEKPSIPDAARYPAPPKPVYAMAVPVDFERPTSDDEPSPQEPPPQVALKQGDFMSVVARVNLTRNTGEFLFANPVSLAMVPTVRHSERAAIRVLDARGKVIAEHNTWLREDTDLLPEDDRTATIDAVFPRPVNPASAELLLYGKVVARREISPNPPRMQAVRMATNSRTLQWKAMDPDGGSLTYLVQGSEDGGKTWLTLAVGLREPTFAPSREQFQRGKTLLRVIANDGWNSSAPVGLGETAKAQ